MANEYYSDRDLDTFKEAQRLAYMAVQNVERRLYEGMTEIDAAALVENFLKEKGISHFFHHSFAWFGERTRFKNFKKIGATIEVSDLMGLPHFGGQFQPSDKKLKSGMPVTLDVAPAIDGCAADIGYSFCFGENAEVDIALKDLEGFRTLILDGVRHHKTLAAIYRDVDVLIKELGYENVHSVYPGAVLGHKVGKIPATFLPAVNVMGFDVQTFLFLGSHKLKEIFSSDKDPLWGPNSEFKAEAGLYAIEPHIGKNDIGVKWEEILVVTDQDAYWLDDDLPHVNLWKAKK